MTVENEKSVNVSYISTACNRTPMCCDWNSQNIICFGASNSVALFNPDYDGSSKITHTLVKHSGKVNTVRWIRSTPGSNDKEIISGSTDGTAILWTVKDNNYTASNVLTEHQNSVTVVDARYVFQNGQLWLYAATASVDSTIKIWKRLQNEDDFKCIQTISLGNGLCLTLQLFALPKVNVPILGCGLDDDKIHLFVEQQDGIFMKVQVLVGHEDWIRGLDFIDIDTKLMLASCSQDTYIRLWSIEPHSDEIKDTEDLQVNKDMFKAGDTEWAVSLEAVLSGHEGWVYGVHWNYDCHSTTQKLKLLSSSIDKSMIIWEPSIIDGKESIWSEVIRVGEVGGSGLGFYGGKFSHSGMSIMGHGYTGSFHIWKFKEELKNWDPAVVCGGHFNEVVDLGWEPEGQFLISISTDQTTRVHAPWVRKDSSSITWHEIARPQVHGFDMSCLAIISRYSFASGAEEKVIRTFQAPKNFITNFHNICRIDDIAALEEGICQGASVPSLGLSNKAVFSTIQEPSNNTERHVKDLYPESYFVPVDLQEPPTEETLMQNTLWPEIHKLYGHGYEVYSLAASSDGELLASACKATTAQHAAILIWCAKTWVQIQSLSSHQLTVTQLAFSPDNNLLLSVSRDRRWSLFSRDPENHFTLIGTTDKSNGIHTRIIWCSAWTSDSKYFFTGSRDGKVVMWGKSEGIPSESSTGPYSSAAPPLELKSQSVTALASAPVKSSCYTVAVGLESGMISIYSIQPANKIWDLIQALDNNIAHHLTVKRLSFRPSKQGKISDKSQLIHLASCSEDHMLKIYSLNINICNT